MANIINQFLQQAGAGNNIKDYKHATRLFVDSNYRLSPKMPWLFHVAFDLNPNLNNLTNESILESGMLVKSATLPKFTIDHKTYNAYNRPNIVQSKVKYDPISIKFHDDSADIIRYFWWNYYHHYYRDSDHVVQEFRQPSKYADRQSQSWGYTPVGYDNTVERMLDAVRIYSLHQRKFTEYTLVNPTITSFKFGEHNNSSSNETMEIEMTLAYETVLYSYGQVVPDRTVKGFGILHYDRTPSPLTPQGGGTQSILGPGGLTAALDTIDNQLGQGNWLGAGLTAFKSFNNFKGANFGQIASNELKTIGMNILNGSNPLAKLQIPSFGGFFGGGGGPNTGSNTFGVAGASSALALLAGSGGPFVQRNYDVASGNNYQFQNIEQVLAGGGTGSAISIDVSKIQQDVRVQVYTDAINRGATEEQAQNEAAAASNLAGAEALANAGTGQTAQAFPVGDPNARGAYGETAAQTKARLAAEYASYGPNYFSPSGTSSVYTTSSGGATIAQRPIPSEPPSSGTEYTDETGTTYRTDPSTGLQYIVGEGGDVIDY